MGPLELLHQGELAGSFIGSPALSVNLAKLEMQRRPLRLDSYSLFKSMCGGFEIAFLALEMP